MQKPPGFCGKIRPINSFLKKIVAGPNFCRVLLNLRYRAVNLFFLSPPPSCSFLFMFVFHKDLTSLTSCPLSLLKPFLWFQTENGFSDGTFLSSVFVSLGFNSFTDRILFLLQPSYTSVLLCRNHCLHTVIPDSESIGAAI